ncbi:MAG: cytochrome c-type biogenesis protein [Gammaproteobacteria bacterium]
MKTCPPPKTPPPFFGAAFARFNIATDKLRRCKVIKKTAPFIFAKTKTAPFATAVLKVKQKIAALLFGAALCFGAAAGGIEIAEFDTAEQDARYRNLVKELRCLVCQNQMLAESDAELAADMRAVIARMVRGGAEESEVIRFMTARYGDFVRYRPPLQWKTAALWILPVAPVLLALCCFPLWTRRRRAVLDAEKLRRAAEILQEETE